MPLCLTATSKRGGHISTVGNDIKSFSAPGVFRDLAAGGTSSAAPQAAGAAAAVWALRPSLTAPQLNGLLQTTARPVTTTSGDPRCTSVQAPPALDAYAAALAADGAITHPARAELLDADNDGAFDEQDLLVFRDAFIASGGNVDYSRHDLNGDGRTGDGRDRFDLDASSPPEWTFSQRREVLGIEVTYDENDVRDLDILCHEAHALLYQGDTAARDLFAEQFCLPKVELEADPPFPASLNPGQTEQLRIRARNPDLSDPTVSHLPGVHLDFNLVSGTMGATSGTTGIDGAFSTSASLGPTGGFEVEVTARAGPGGPVLDQLTVTATRGSGPITIMEGETFLVANAELDDEVKENEDPNYSDTVSAAEDDASASASLSTALDQSSEGFTFTGVASITATDERRGSRRLRLRHAALRRNRAAPLPNRGHAPGIGSGGHGRPCFARGDRLAHRVLQPHYVRLADRDELARSGRLHAHGGGRLRTGRRDLHRQLRLRPRCGRLRPAVTDHYQRPGWFTKNVFNRVVAGLARSRRQPRRLARARGARPEERRVEEHAGEPAQLRRRALHRGGPRADALGAEPPRDRRRTAAEGQPDRGVHRVRGPG